MSIHSTSFWPDLLGTQAQMEFWLNSPEIPTAKAANTRYKLAQPLLRGELQKMWVGMYTYLCKARANGPKVDTTEITALCQELAATGVLSREEVATTKHRLMIGTAREFAWHAPRLRAVCAALLEEKQPQEA